MRHWMPPPSSRVFPTTGGGLLFVILCLWTLATACTETVKLQDRCQFDTDCGPFQRCLSESGSCVCGSDAACAAGEYCNGISCQVRIGCDSSLDCPEGQFCDTATQQCLDAVRCTSDIQCDLGQVCDSLEFTCVDGCRQTGDCTLGDVCRCSDGLAPGEGRCTVGTCERGTCDDDSYCRYGERCVQEDDGVKRCRADERGPYCGACSITPGASTRCGGDGANFCLSDRKVEWNSTYCGVDCSNDEPCPWGYQCRPILVLTRSFCTEDNDCPAIGARCEGDADCPGGRCDPVSRKCAGVCSYNEDSKKGYCTCTQDSECPQDVCNTTKGRCEQTLRPCTPDGGECDRPLYCVNRAGRGACLVGRNCVPIEGLRCQDVRRE